MLFLRPQCLNQNLCMQKTRAENEKAIDDDNKVL